MENVFLIVFILSVNNKKVLGIDYGDFTIGLAIFCVDDDFIYPLKTIKRDKANVLRKSIREIIEIVDEEGISEIVVGLPLNANGTSGIRVEKVNEFVKMLKTKLKSYSLVKEKKEINIIMQDERLTTKEATSILYEHGIKKMEHKKIIDQVAAELILGDYREMLAKLSNK